MTGNIYKSIVHPAAIAAGVQWVCSSCRSKNVSKSETSLQAFKTSVQEEINKITLGVENQLRIFKESLVKEYKTFQQSNSEVTETITSYAFVLYENVDCRKRLKKLL